MRIIDAENNNTKDIHWMPGTKDDMKSFPEIPRKNLGHALWMIQQGETPDNVTPFEGSAGNSILKIVERYDTDTYRVVFAAKFEDTIYILHAFKKKSNTGKSTPKKEIDTVLARYKAVNEIEKEKHRKK